MSLPVSRLVAARVVAAGAAAALGLGALITVPATAQAPAASPVARPWTPVSTVVAGTNLTSQLFGTRVVGLPDGSAVAAWTDLAGDIETATRSAAGTWSAPTQLATGAVPLAQPSLAASPSGDLAVAWKTLATGQSAIKAATKASSASSWTVSTLTSGLLSATSLSAPVLAYGSGDAATKLVAGWQTLTGPAVSVFNGSSWLTPSTVTSVIASLSNVPLTIAVSPAGNITVAWNAPLLNVVDAATLASGASTFGPIHQLTTSLGLIGTTLTTLSDGSIAAGWLDGGGMNISTLGTGTAGWSTVQTLAGGLLPKDLTIVPGLDGAASALWISGAAGAQQLMASTLTGTTWSTPTAILTAASGQTLGNLLATGGNGVPSIVISSCATLCDVLSSTLSGGSFPTPTGVPGLSGLTLGGLDLGGLSLGSDPLGHLTIVLNTLSGAAPQLTALQSVTSLLTMSSTSAPTITGTRIAGQTLTAHEGSWSSTPDSYSYQWMLDGNPISGATGSTYIPTLSMGLKHVTVVVTAHKALYSDAAATSAAAQVRRPHERPLSLPTISGTRAVGHVLSATPGRWSPTPGKTTYQWKRNGKVIKGATKSRYRLVRNDRNHTITVTVTAARTYFITESATSKKTSAVK